ncbi:hypothetical protein M758_8G127700 [Ceratodon purpureus]|nr:hypothetical protein M758_8G127700 [Ceratodon purpureus]
MQFLRSEQDSAKCPVLLKFADSRLVDLAVSLTMAPKWIFSCPCTNPLQSFDSQVVLPLKILNLDQKMQLQCSAVSFTTTWQNDFFVWMCKTVLRLNNLKDYFL